jgi:hypothetical protein
MFAGREVCQTLAAIEAVGLFARLCAIVFRSPQQDMPKAWWPPEWASKLDHPVVELKKALYGHPLAGKRWHQRLEDELVALGFKEIEGWPSVYAKCDGLKKGHCLCCLR